MKKLTLIAGGLAGFLIGSYAGRGPYERVETWGRQVSGRPQVRRVADQVTESANKVSDAATGTASKVADRAAGSTAEAVSSVADHLAQTMDDVGGETEHAPSTAHSPSKTHGHHNS